MNTEDSLDKFTEELTAERDELLDALESMTMQYIECRVDEFGMHSGGHNFMSAGENATYVLAKYYPDRWKDDGCGPVWVGGER